MTYTERIIELYQKKGNGKYIFRFKGNIDMNKNGDIINIMRPVIITE